MTADADLGARIEWWLDFRKMSREDLAKACGVTVAAVYQWIGTGTGHRTTPSTANLLKIVAAFDTTLDRFFAKKVA